jgi:MFS family permease
MNKRATKKSILNYGLIVMAVSHTLTHVFGGMHTALFSEFRNEFNLNLQQLGLIAAIPSLTSAILSIPIGLLSDRFGSKKMLLLSFGFATAGAILAGTASNQTFLIIAISLIYINTTIYHPASYSATTKMFSSKDRPKALGLHGAGGTLGHALGPLSISILVGLFMWQWRQVYLFLAVPMILGVLMVLKLPTYTGTEETVLLEEKSAGGKFLTKNLVMFLVYQALRMIGRSIVATFLVLYLQDIRTMELSVAAFISSTNTLSGLIAAPIGGYIAARIGEMKWLQYSLLCSFSLLAISFNIPNNTMFMILYFLHGFFGTLGMASRSAIMAKLTPKKQRGLGYALFFLPGSIIGAFAPVAAGYIAELMGFQIIFNIAILVYFLSLAILRFTVKID